MIAIIDMNSDVRHGCFHMLSKENIAVAVFYSALTFVNSGAVYVTEILALGKTRSCRTSCDTLRWASSVRPELRTLLLNPMRLCIRPLPEVCRDLSDRLAEIDSSVSLDALRQAHTLGLFKCADGLSYQSFVRIQVDLGFRRLPEVSFLDKALNAHRHE